MPTLANTTARKLKYLSHLLWEYSFYLRQELRNPTVYLTSLTIGLSVAWLMHTLSVIPFLVSCIVLIAANAILQFRKQDIETLLMLPAQREDPAFIMDLGGNVVLSAGKTNWLFKKEAFNNIVDFIGADSFDRLINTIDHSCIDPETRSIDIYSERLQNWYKIKFKPIVSRCGSLPEKVLVWRGYRSERGPNAAT